MEKTVLIVDDQIGIRYLLEEVIQQEGYKTELAEDGKEALNKIEQNCPDLLMLDYKLPLMNAYQIVQQLEEQQIAVPTIIMSGLPDKAEEYMHSFDSVKQIVAKPFQLNDIRDIVNTYLE